MNRRRAPSGGRPGVTVRAHAPGRVNLIGDHTDYSGGLVLPMAIDRGTTVSIERGGDRVELSSGNAAQVAVVPIGGDVDPRSITPRWARYVAGVVAVVRPTAGARGTVRTTLPLGAGLSSSAALEVAVALALGAVGSPRTLAQACQRAEHLASGVPCGIMDQLASVSGVAGHALLIDCDSLQVTPVLLPGDVEVLVVHSGQTRALAASAYSNRRAEVDAVAAAVGEPVRAVTEAGMSAIRDPVLRRRGRHVVSENARVLAFVEAMADCDPISAGKLMLASHHSLRDDFEVSTPALDQLVEHLSSTPGVFGARLTGAGFGGCVVALTSSGRGSSLAADFKRAWVVRAAAGAAVQVATVP